MNYSANTSTENPSMPRGTSGASILDMRGLRSDEAWVDIPLRSVPYTPDPSEVRTIDPDTGGEKGMKLARHDLIPVKALHELAEHYGKGCEKYAEHNWRKGLAWSKSYAALQRHITAFWGGEDLDLETGSKHVIAAAWHCLTLSTYMDEQRAKDDRYKN
jgi:Domain of unknown function (DUF5664)